MQVGSLLSITHLVKTVPYYEDKGKVNFFAPMVQVSTEDGIDVWDEAQQALRHVNYKAKIIILDDEGPFHMKGYVLNPNANGESAYCCSMGYKHLEYGDVNEIRLIRTTLTSAIRVNCHACYVPLADWGWILDFLDLQ